MLQLYTVRSFKLGRQTTFYHDDDGDDDDDDDHHRYKIEDKVKTTSAKFGHNENIEYALYLSN